MNEGLVVGIMSVLYLSYIKYINDGWKSFFMWTAGTMMFISFIFHNFLLCPVCGYWDPYGIKYGSLFGIMGIVGIWMAIGVILFWGKQGDDKNED